MGVEFSKSNQIRNREHKHELHENGLVMLGIKNMEYQYVSMLFNAHAFNLVVGFHDVSLWVGNASTS